MTNNDATNDALANASHPINDGNQQLDTATADKIAQSLTVIDAAAGRFRTVWEGDLWVQSLHTSPSRAMLNELLVMRDALQSMIDDMSDSTNYEDPNG